MYNHAHYFISLKMSNLSPNTHKVFFYLILVFISICSLPSLVFGISWRQCSSRAGSSDYCVCSLSSAIDRIITIVKGSQVESQLASFQCTNFIQLPSSLTKSEEFPVVLEKYQGDNQERTRKQHTNEESNSKEEYQDANAKEEAPAEEIYEHPRYSVDSQGRRTGPRFKKRRFRRQSFFQFPSPLEIPKHHRSKRQVALGVPTADTFSKVVAKMPSPKDLHQYVPLGSSATLQCFNLEKHPQFKKWSNKKFTWTYFDGRPVTTSQMSVDKKTGALSIYAVQLQDTDVYNCTVDLINKNSEIEMTESFSHQIDVVSEPAFWLQISVFYSTDSDSCFPEEIYDIEKSISPWVHAYACENCDVRNISVMCQHNEEGTKILIQMIITTMGIESKIPTLKFGTLYSCPLTCSEKLHLKLLELIDASLVKMFLLPIMLTDEDGESIWYDPVKAGMNTEVVEGCLSGFYQAYKLCFPCDIGKYSPNGKVDCIPCPKGSYQNKQGSSGCIRCAEGLSTLSEGSTMELSCVIPTVFDGAISWIQIHWIMAIVIFLLVSIIMKIVIFMWCFPTSKVTAVIKLILCCFGCFHEVGDCCANCCKRPVIPKKSSKELRRGSALLLTTDTNDNDDTDASSDPDDSSENFRKSSKRNLKDKLNALGSRASKFLPKSAKRMMKNTLSETNINNAITSKLLPAIPKKLRQMIPDEDDKDTSDDDASVPVRKTKTLPAKNAANDGVIEQLKTVKNIGNNLRSKLRRKDAIKV